MAGRKAIGLDVGSSALRAAQLSFGRGGMTLERIAEVPLPEGVVRDGEVVDGPAVTAATKALWRAGRFSTRKVALGVANQRVIVREVELPEMPLSDLGQALPFQVQDQLPIPVEIAVLDFHPTDHVVSPSGSRLMRGLLVAAEREMVIRNVQAVQAAGLVVTSVDLIPFALLRSIGTGLDVDTDTEALVDIGDRMTYVIVHSAGVPRLVRVLPTGGHDITDAIAERLQVPFAEAEQLKLRLGVGGLSSVEPAAEALASSALPFIDEIRSSLEYYAASHPRHPAERIVLTGGGARLSGLADRMGVMTRLPVIADDTLPRLARGRAVHAEDGDSLPSWGAVPVGLAMGAVL